MCVCVCVYRMSNSKHIAVPIVHVSIVNSAFKTK